MSRSFRHGYKVVNTDLIALSRELNVALEPVRTWLISRDIARCAVEIVDGQENVENLRTESFLFYEATRLWERRVKSYPTSHTLHDPLRFSMAFLDTPQGEILAAPYFSAHRGDHYVAALNTMDGLMEYGVNPNYAERVPEDNDRIHAWHSAWQGRVAGHALLTFELPNTMDPLLCITPDVEKFYEVAAQEQQTPQQRLRNNLITGASDRALEIIRQRSVDDMGKMLTEYAMHTVMVAARRVAVIADDELPKYGKLPEPIPTAFFGKKVEDIEYTDFKLHRESVDDLAERLVTEMVYGKPQEQ